MQLLQPLPPAATPTPKPESWSLWRGSEVRNGTTKVSPVVTTMWHTTINLKSRHDFQILDFFSMFSRKCFFGWYVVNARLTLIPEVCSMWKLCPKSGSHTHTHTHTHTRTHVTSSTTEKQFIILIQSQSIQSNHRWSFKNFLQTSPTPRKSFQVSMTAKDCLKLSLPTAGIRVPIAIQAIPTSYAPWIFCVAINGWILRTSWCFLLPYTVNVAAVNVSEKRKNSNIIKSIMFTIHKCIEMQHDNFFHVWNTSQIYHKLSKSGMYVGKCSPTLKAM